eukprot:GHVT01023376.1.p2 GENE.GHVT01023376.1~~GHVT01023376.1.p2  ORF type:complete len:150 (+),score=34.08 GHVT01023376.1:1939-2388(+)
MQDAMAESMHLTHMIQSLQREYFADRYRAAMVEAAAAMASSSTAAAALRPLIACGQSGAATPGQTFVWPSVVAVPRPVPPSSGPAATPAGLAVPPSKKAVLTLTPDTSTGESEDATTFAESAYRSGGNASADTSAATVVHTLLDQCNQP